VAMNKEKNGLPAGDVVVGAVTVLLEGVFSIGSL
jgi:hypothetical protein